ncbi:MAG: TIGR03545 family protein [Desulfobacteraceae bacterium]
MKKFIKKIIRFFLYLTGFMLVLLCLLYFLRNLILDYAIEKGGSKVNGAKVEVHDVNLNLFSQSISWGKIEAADKNDPWKNILETGFTEFKIELIPLTGSKVIIDSMIVRDIQSGTERKTDGSIPVPEEDLKEDKKPSWIKDFALKQLEKEKQAIPVLNKDFFRDFSDTDKIVESLDLVTPVKVDEAKAYIEERKVFWENHFKKRNYEQRAKEIEADFKEIKGSENKKPEEILAAIEKIQDLKEKCVSFKKDLRKDRVLAEKDLEKINQYKKDFPGWVESDLEKAAKAVNIKNGGLERISEMLFGKRVVSAGEKIVKITGLIRNSLKKSEKTEKPEKIKADKFQDLPAFWIKKSEVSFLVTESNYSFSGNILNISSDQNKTGRPAVFDFMHNDAEAGNIIFKGIIDFRDLEDIISFDLNCTDFVLNNFKLTSDDLVPLVLRSGRADIDSSFVSKPELIKFSGNIKIRDHVFEKNGSKNHTTLEKLVLEAAESAEVLDISLLVNLDKNKKEISVKSSLGSVISDRISSYVKGKAQAETKKIEKMVRTRIEEKRKELVSSSGEGNMIISENISDYEKKIGNEEEKINAGKKELEKKIKSKIDDKKDELLDKLKIKF